jgi:DNA modification methylase
VHRNTLTITYRKLAELIPYKNNPRRHNRKQIKALARSLERHGWTNPIIIDGGDEIIAGHGRYQAAMLLEMVEVPTIMLADMSKADKRAYVIADNKLAELSGWDRDLLRSEFNGLIEIGYEIELTGFPTFEVDNVLNVGAEETEADEPPVEEPNDADPVVSRVGDLWQVGSHRLICGDARQLETYEQLFSAGQVAQMTFTDPPYGVRIAGNVSGLGKHKHGEFVMGSVDLTSDALGSQLLRPAFRNIARFSGAGAIAFICMDWRGARLVQDAADGVLEELKNLIVWVKTNAGMGSFYRSQHELVFAYKVSKGEHINNFGLGSSGRHRSNVWTYAGANTFRKDRDKDLADHPTVKSKKMIADAILDCSKQGGIVLDPFAGSGTTLIAAEMTGRIGYGIELDPKYCDVILRRLEAETGLTATLADKSFAEVAKERHHG